MNSLELTISWPPLQCPSLPQVNIQPQTRKARQAQMYREDLEKMRLAARRENYCHYEVRPRQ